LGANIGWPAAELSSGGGLDAAVYVGPCCVGQSGLEREYVAMGYRL
jgi:hypothetical protein